MRGSTLRECAAAAGRAVGAEPPLGMDAERRSLWADAAEQAAQEALTFPDFASFLSHVAERPAAATRDDGVVISPIHAAKGLAWAWVFVAGCDAQLLPPRQSDAWVGERPHLYVALNPARRAAPL